MVRAAAVVLGMLLLLALLPYLDFGPQTFADIINPFGGGGKVNLLASIEGFKRGKLKKTKTKEPPAPAERQKHAAAKGPAQQRIS